MEQFSAGSLLENHEIKRSSIVSFLYSYITNPILAIRSQINYLPIKEGLLCVFLYSLSQLTPSNMFIGQLVWTFFSTLAIILFTCLTADLSAQFMHLKGQSIKLGFWNCVAILPLCIVPSIHKGLSLLNIPWWGLSFITLSVCIFYIYLILKSIEFIYQCSRTKGLAILISPVLTIGILAIVSFGFAVYFIGTELFSFFL